MVINEKVLVREMKEAYKGWGYTVMVMPGDRWVIRRKDAWSVEIENQDNVPNEVLALMVLHMGYLPKAERCYRVYKGDKCTCVQREVYSVEEEEYLSFVKERQKTDSCPLEIRRTSLIYGLRRVWQKREDKQILLIDPRFEGLMDHDGDQMIRTVGENIYLEGEISCVYITRARGGAAENLLDHLAQVSWT